MQVIVLGGAGVMGSRVVQDLAGSDGVEKVTVADKDERKARELARSIGTSGAEVEAVRVDAFDHSSLVSAMKGNDVAASALGPFYLFESRLVAAALDASVDYVSICDDWSATQEVFIRFDALARDRGVTVVTGSGASPGLTNIAAKFLADRLDEVERVDINVYVPAQSREGVATIMHALFVYGTTVPVFRDGTTQMLTAGSESLKVEMPGAGAVKLWNCGHSEPVTLPRYIPGIRDINMMMGVGTGSGAIVAAGRLGVFKSPRRRELLSRAFVALEGSSKPTKQAGEGAVRVDVGGTLDGRRATLTGCGTASMRDSTGLALSVGTLLAASKKLTAQGGVFAPEGCFSPEAFLKMMDARGIHIYSDTAMSHRLVGH
jgi:saccharopine dehydrogenase-like NADP-dependent oxidoreductase